MYEAVEPRTDRAALVDELDATHADIGRAQRRLLAMIPAVDRESLWERDGARDTAHWLAMRYGISEWKARRWIVAAAALEQLPMLAAALSSGELGIDKVVELARFAAPETERGLIAWAKEVTTATVRHRGDLHVRAERAELVEVQRSRSLTCWYLDDGRRFGLEAVLPAAEGAVVAKALERVAREVPAMPDEEGPGFADARRADALVALCSAKVADDPDPDRATVVVHASLDGLRRGTGGCEIEDGPVIAPATVERLLCNVRHQTVVEDEAAAVVRLGRTSREPPAWMLRQVRYRDRGCRFPGCGARRFTEAHHVAFWRDGGRTELQNLLLICSFHHRLVHEHGWSVRLGPDGSATWRRPGGVRYRAGPAPGASGSSARAASASRNPSAAPRTTRSNIRLSARSPNGP